MKKKFIERMALILMAFLTAMSFAACARELNVENANEICELLQKKYNTEFEVISIGNRLASENARTVTAYCRPKNDADVVFEVKANADRELVYDDYYISVLETAEKRRIESACREAGVEAAVSFIISSVDRNSITESIQLEELVSRNDGIYLTFSTIVSDCGKPEELYDTLYKFLDEYHSYGARVGTGTTVWKLEADAYDKCLEEMRKKPVITSNFLKSLNPSSSSNIAIVDGKVNNSKENFLESFR